MMLRILFDQPARSIYSRERLYFFCSLLTIILLLLTNIDEFLGASIANFGNLFWLRSRVLSSMDSEFRAVKYLQRGQYYLDRALKINPNGMPISKNMGILLFVEDEIEAANRLWQESGCDIAFELVERGKRKLESEDFRLAEKWLKSAIYICPSFCESWYFLGDFYLEQEDIEKAYQTLERGCSCSLPGQVGISDFYYQLGYIEHYSNRDLDTASYQYTRALAASDFGSLDGKVKTLWQIGNLLMSQGRICESTGYYRKALSLKSTHFPSLMALGNAYKELGRADASEVVFRNVVESYPNRPEGYLALGNLLLETGRCVQARRLVAESLRILDGNRKLSALAGSGTDMCDYVYFTSPR